MFRKIITLIIVALLSNGFTTYAQTSSAEEIKFKRQIVEFGTDQKVKVKLQSGETLKGRIAEIKNDSFTLQFINASGQVTSRDLTYGELSKVSKAGDQKASSGGFKQGFLQGFGGALGVIAAVVATSLIIGAVTN